MKTEIDGHWFDHAAEALALLRRVSGSRMSDGEASVSVSAAQVLATLALVEQQRIANLVSIAGLDWRRGPSASQHASSYLVDEVGDLLPEIASALGLTVGEDGRG